MSAGSASPLRNATLHAAVNELRQDYAAGNPASAAHHAQAQAALPGGNTRTVLYYAPFPLTFARGEGATLWDIDGHAYTDILAEFTAGVCGHSHPAIRAAINRALDGGISLGGHNTLEPRFAAAIQARFPTMAQLRFTNSGTEANLLAISTAIAATGRSKVMVFQGGYHGAVFMFSGGPSMNAPFDYLLVPYNDTEATLAAIAAHADTLACVILEPMLGGGGCIPASGEFLAALRAATERHGIVLIFDEVMTSRLAPGGLQSLVGITPDLTTLGKYVGGGMSFGAFGGRADLMAQFDPRQPGALPHAGTFNNNVLTMSAGLAALTEVYTPEAALVLNTTGEDLRARLNQAAASRPMHFTGIGSMLSVHFTAQSPRSPSEAASGGDHAMAAKELFFFDLLRAGFWPARRGMIVLSVPLTADDIDRLVATVAEFVAMRGALLE